MSSLYRDPFSLGTCSTETPSSVGLGTAEVIALFSLPSALPGTSSKGFNFELEVDVPEPPGRGDVFSPCWLTLALRMVAPICGEKNMYVDNHGADTET